MRRVIVKAPTEAHNLDKKGALKLSYRILILATILVFIAGTYNIISFISGLTGSAISPILNKDEATGDWSIIFNGNPMNKGFLDISLSFEITVLDVTGQVVATNSTTLLMRVGSSQTLSLSLEIPSEMVPEGNIEEARGLLEMKMSIRELGGLLGLTQIMRVGSGVQ